MTTSSKKIVRAMAERSKAVRAVYEEISGVRAEIVRTRQAAREVEALPPPMSEALALIDAELDRLQDVGLVGLEVRSIVNQQFDESEFRINTDDRLLPGLMALIGRDAIRTAAAAKLEEAYRGRPGIDQGERQARLDAFAAELLDLEFVEEAIIRQAEGAGLDISRRQDADPRAVLAPSSRLPA